MRKPPRPAHGAGERNWSIENGRGLSWVLAAAVAVKAVVLLEVANHPLLQPHGDLDTTRYVELAKQIAAGGPLAVREPFFLSPLYVYFLAAVFSVGGSLFAARVVQILLGSAAAGFLYVLGREWFGARVGELAAVLALLTGFFTFSEILILQSALDPVLTAAALYLVARTQTTRARWPLVGTGLALGLFALNRPNGIVYGVAAAGLIGLATRTSAAVDPPMSWRPVVTRVSLVLVFLFAVLGANALRNYLVSGEWILISSHGGLNFYIGNNSNAKGIYTPVPGVAASITGQVRDATRVAETAEGRSLSQGEVSSYFYRSAWRWIAGHPGPALKLLARKGATLLNRTDVPLNYSYAFYRDESIWLRLLAVGPMLLLPFGLVGLFLGTRPAPGSLAASQMSADSAFPYWTWASFVPIYGASVAAFFVSDRYRMPLLIPLAVLAARALVWISERIRARQFAALILPIAGLALAAILVAWDLGLDDGRGGERARKAGWLIERGSYEEARRYAAGAGEGLGHAGVFHFRVGQAFTSAGRYDDAIDELRAALAIDRGQPAIELALGQALLLAGRAEEAVVPLNAAVQAAFRPEVSGPWLVRGLAAAGRRTEAVRTLASLSDAVVKASGAATAAEIGSLGLELAAPAPAERWLRAAAAEAPDSPDPQEKLAVALLLQGRASEALAPIERACRLAPSSASARLNLAVTYAQLGRFMEARAAAAEAVRLDSSEPRAAALLEQLNKKH